MEKKATLATATDWRAEIKNEIRQKIVHSICAKLKEKWAANCADATNVEKITDLAIEHEKKLFNNAKSKEQYFSVLTRKKIRSDNRHESSSSQDGSAFSSDQSAVLITKDAFVSRPSPQMTNQPHLPVPNLQYQQPALPNSILQQHIQQSNPQPHEQPDRQKLNIRQTNQQFGMHNQRFVSSQNTLNSPCRPRSFQNRDFGILMAPEMFIQHPKVVYLQPNQNLTAHVKEEVIDEDFQAPTLSHQHHTAVEQHKQHQSMGVSVVPNGNPNAEDWLDHAFSEKQRLKGYLPVLKKAYNWASEQRLQVGRKEQIEKWEHEMMLLRNMMIFLEFPRDRIISYTKEKFYRSMQAIVKCVKALEDRNVNLANLQQSLHGQPGLSQPRMKPAQQSDNVNPHFLPVNLTTALSSDGSSPIAPQKTGFLRSEADCIRKYLLQNRQYSEHIKQEFPSSWIQQKQMSTENIQAINRSGMTLEKYQLNSKFSPQTHQASQPFQIAERTHPKSPCSSLHERASPTPFSSTVGLGKKTSHVSHLSCLNFQSPQACNALKLLDTTKEIQVQPHEIRSPSTMTSQFAEPTGLGNNLQLSTSTKAADRLLKAVESISKEALSVAVAEISSVQNMGDKITEPWYHEKATHFSLQDRCGSSNNMKRKIGARTLNDMSSPCSDTDGSECTVTLSKKFKKLPDDALLVEIRNINKKFIETVLEIDSDENLNRRLANAGTVLRCSYSAATESKNSLIHSAKILKLPVLSVKLLVPLDYPEDYPVFLSKFNTNCGTEDDEFRDMSSEATSMLRAFLRTAPDALSLEDYARTWNECARTVVSEHARRAGGGCFSSQYGTWEDCVAAT